MTQFDVVVLGGGLVGCAAAYYLSKGGARVLLLEQGELNREASGRNAGSLHFQLEYRLIRYGEELAAQFAKVIPLSLMALEDWRGLEQELQTDLELELHGGLIVAESADDLASLEQRQALQARWGLQTEMLAGGALRSFAPYLADSVLGAAYFPHEGHANPRLTTLAFARSASARGAEVRCYMRAIALERDGSQWRVEAVDRTERREEISTRAVLNAAGAWAGDIGALAHLHLPIFAIPLTMNVLERTARLIPHLVQHASERLTAKQLATGNVLVGGGQPSRFPRAAHSMDLGARAEPVIENVVENLALAMRLIPAIGALHLLRSWTGVTGVTADQMPLLGETPEAPGFFIAAGGAAFTHGPTYARLISELILTGRTPAAIDLYSPARFSHVNNFMAAV